MLGAQAIAVGANLVAEAVRREAVERCAGWTASPRRREGFGGTFGGILAVALLDSSLVNVPCLTRWELDVAE
jgi:hypothetical protein